MSSRGVKQGDPLSPTLFIIAAEVLSRGLNRLHSDTQFKGYGIPKWSPEINHLFMLMTPSFFVKYIDHSS